MIKKILLGISLALVLSLSACSKQVEVTIKDENATTTIEVKVPNTVEAILNEAEITIGEEDAVSPALDEKLEDAGEITIQRMHNVKIVVDGEEKKKKMLGGTVDDLFKQESIVLNDNMSMNVNGSDALKDNMEIIIESAYGVKIKHDGKEETLSASPGTIEDFLKSVNITLGEDDTINPSLDTEIKEGLEIVIERITYEEVSETEVIPYGIAKQNDASMQAGQEVVVVQGKNGEKKVTYRIKKVDGEEVEKEVISEEVTVQAVNAVVNVGTKPAVYELYRTDFPNCSGDGHGYYEVHYSDGTVAYINY